MGALLRDAARDLGFEAVGFARAEEHPHAPRLRAWLDEGKHGTMAWMARDPERRGDPRRVLPGALTVLSVLASYYRGDWPAPYGGARTGDAATAEPPRGRVARYAWGRDYHGRVMRRLRKLGRVLESHRPGARWRAYVDNGPMLDRAWAERAGLGWIGKNANLIRQGAGSWFFIGEIVTDAPLPVDPPARNHCGRCARCLSACPTGAIVAPYQVDARRCISYLTIEHAGPIPVALRGPIGTRIFGCDDCQEACPWNRFAVPTYEPDFAERSGQTTPWLVPLLSLDEEGFRTRFGGTPLMRAGRDLIVRNAAVALGNLGDPRTVPALGRSLAGDPSPLVRGHAAWALGRIGTDAARRALETALDLERDEAVRGEIAGALAPPGDASGDAAPPGSR